MGYSEQTTSPLSLPNATQLCWEDKKSSQACFQERLRRQWKGCFLLFPCPLSLQDNSAHTCLTLGAQQSVYTLLVKSLLVMQETWVRSLVWEHSLEKEMATYSSILAWRNRVAQIWTQLKRFSTHMKDKHLYLLSCCTLRKGNPSDAHMNMSIKYLKHALMGIFSFSMKPLEFTKIMKCPLNCALFVSLVARGLPG